MSSGVKPTRIGLSRGLLTSEDSTGTTSGSNVDWVTSPSGASSISNNDQWKQPVRVATTANGTLATAYENGDTIDGVTLATGDRILLKDQTTTKENGIYTVNASGAPTRATDFDDSIEVLGAVVYVIAGTTNKDTMWGCSLTTAPVIDTDAITFVSAGGGSGFSDPMTTRGDIIIRNASNVTARLGVGGSNTFLSSNGTDVSWAAGASGGATELDYVEFTSNVSVTATTEATANTVVTGSAVAYNGSTKVVIEFFCAQVQPQATAGTSITFALYDGSSSIGLIGQFTVGTSNTFRWGGTLQRRLTPSNATHTYSIRAYTGSGTGSVNAGSGGTGNLMPGFIRIVQV